MSTQDEKTIHTPEPPSVQVHIEKGQANKIDFEFSGPFRLGRDKSCEIHFSDPEVSRAHAEFWFLEDQWWVYDLQSANGTFLDGIKIERAPLTGKNRIMLGIDGPILVVTIEGVTEAEQTQTSSKTVTQYIQRYFSNTGEHEIGEHTLMLRRAYDRLQKKQKKKYAIIIVVIVCLFVASGAYAILKHMESRKQKQLAENIFYTMKSLELEFAGFLKAARLSRDTHTLEQLEKYRARRKEMEKNYEQFIETLDIYGKKTTEEDRIILRIARTFGECEINMPSGFSEEVDAYIEKCQSSDRMVRAIDRAIKYGYIKKIAETLLEHDLPPQFAYIALQESDFDVYACGPKTRYGIAKGPWQFIPSTAINYGLRTGPLVNVRQPDPRDERHHMGKSTLAAARYIRDIYDTEAQASGLLVIASYNWGERRVIELIRNLPENPKERNFWRLLAEYRDKIPQETYDYVFYIIAAAVIAENPRLFGFEFDNPLAYLDEKLKSEQ